MDDNLLKKVEALNDWLLKAREFSREAMLRFHDLRKQICERCGYPFEDEDDLPF